MFKDRTKITTNHANSPSQSCSFPSPYHRELVVPGNITTNALVNWNPGTWVPEDGRDLHIK